MNNFSIFTKFKQLNSNKQIRLSKSVKAPKCRLLLIWIQIRIAGSHLPEETAKTLGNLLQAHNYISRYKSSFYISKEVLLQIPKAFKRNWNAKLCKMVMIYDLICIVEHKSYNFVVLITFTSTSCGTDKLYAILA